MIEGSIGTDRLLISRTRFLLFSLFCSQDRIDEKAKRESEQRNLAVLDLNLNDCGLRLS